ncbi:MAG: hypothetical protein ACKO5K_03605 [Armatimonadota bacterium]
MALTRPWGPGFGRDLLRAALVLLLLPYALEKMLPVQFRDAASLANRTVASLDGMEAIWAFFGHSRGYQIAVGAVQLAACAAFAWRPSARVGGCLYLAVIANVLLVDATFRVQTAMWVFAAAMTLGCLSWMALESVAYRDALKRLCTSDFDGAGVRDVLAWAGAVVIFLVAHRLSRLLIP